MAAMTGAIRLPGRSASCRRGSRSSSSPDASRAVVAPNSAMAQASSGVLSRCRRRRRSAPIWNCSQPRRDPSFAPPGRSCASVTWWKRDTPAIMLFSAGGCHHGGTPLRLGVVRASEHADLTVRAGEPGGPLDRVVAVVELLVARGELAVRGVAATDVLHHDDVAARSEEHRVGVHQVDVDVLVVRLSGQQHRVTTVVCGPVDVGPQHDPVAHPCLDVVLDQNVVSPRDRSGHGASPAGGNEGDGTIDGQSSRILCTIASSAIE